MAASVSFRGVLFPVAVTLGALAVWLGPPGAIVDAKQAKAPTGGRKAAHSSTDGYVGTAACAGCHRKIYESYLQTKMGRSMTLVTPAVIQSLGLPVSTYSAKLDRHYEVFSKDGKLYQSEWQTGAGGQEIFRNTQQTDWIIGAGANGFGALLQRGDSVFEAPLSFYTKVRTWELSPGYEARDIGFNRPVQADCIYCHSGRPKPLAGTSGKFEPTPFAQLAIGCENCHGPGAAHILAMHGHHAGDKGTRIVNPDDLSANLQDDICMSCHEGGDSRVPKPGKTYADFRPGKPLDDTLSIFMTPMRRDNPEDSEHVQHYLQMSMSRCFRESKGQMSCTTCHDPHVEPTREEAPAYFNAKCMVCHANRQCSLPVAARQATTPVDNCIGCHMIRRISTESAHTTLTNHRILSKPDEPWPDIAFNQTSTTRPDLVHLDRPDKGPDDLPAITLLAAYNKIMQTRPEYRDAYLKELGKAEETDPNNAEIQMQLGYRDLRNQNPDAAIEHLQRSIKLDPNVALAYAYLSEALKRKDKNDEAIAAIEKGVALEPYNQQLQRAQLDRLLVAKQYRAAQTVAEHYIQLFPEDPVMRKILAQLIATP